MKNALLLFSRWGPAALLLMLVLYAPSPALIIPFVPDVQQPTSGSLGNPTHNSCVPISSINVTQYWDAVQQHGNAHLVNAGLIPNTAADYIAYFIDQCNWGSPLRFNGTIYPPSCGTYSADIQFGLLEFVRWDQNYPFTTPPPNLPVNKLGYAWNVISDFGVGFNFHTNEINMGRPNVVCFRYWNPIFSGFTQIDMISGELIEFYNWGPIQGGSLPPNPEETWNLNYGQECVGHAVTGVGYYANYDPDGYMGPLPQTDWIICHDNWPTTGVNIAIPWQFWAATVAADPGPELEIDLDYWKPDTTYAPYGMLDFSSRRPCWSGPTAVTNCLWWYGALDYYPFGSPTELRDELFYYFASDTIFDPWGGTDVHQMELGLDAFFNDADPAWPFYETTYLRPNFHEMAESLMVCQDVILLIGYWWMSPDGLWWRDGGHYVTMAGVDTANMLIGLSDPESDMAELGFPGRVRPPHANHDPRDSTHWIPVGLTPNDFPVSHDIYPVVQPSPSPGGTWYLPGFPRGFSPTYANCPIEFQINTAPNPDPLIYPYCAEVEYAVMICPRVPEEPIDTCSYYKPPYPDFAPNGAPDFDQKQDGWWNPQLGNWSWCGPVALANCLWWFDSKFEPNPLDPRPFYPDPTSPLPNDGYPMITPYGPWDDHDLNNVIPFVSQLGPMCGVDGPMPGTPIPQLEIGFHNWLISVGLEGQYSSFIRFGPTYEELRDSILSCQDVILLLGFYELNPLMECQWLGGHYVTAAGVCSDELAICISDPFFDSNEGEPPPGIAHPSFLHNDASLVSGPHGSYHHDRYNMSPIMVGCPSPATWMLTDYPNNWTQDGIFTFANQNALQPMPPVQYAGGPIVVLVDAALIICPVVQQHIPDIDVIPDSLNYVQLIGTMATYPKQLIICNTGNGPLSIDSLKCDLNFVSLAPIPAIIQPGICDSIDLTINTNFINPGMYSGYFHIFSNDPDEPLVNKPFISVLVTAPDIDVYPDSIYHELPTGSSVTYINDFRIYNNGNGDLYYGTNPTPFWLTLTGVTGYIVPGGLDQIDVNLNANGISPGIYSYTIILSSNDPDTPSLNAPVIVMNVTDTSSAACDVTPGDANGNGTFNGLDVTYSVNYLKGIGGAPPDTCDCPPYLDLLAAADANGNCAYNGLDVTYSVNYLKGIGPAPALCDDCPTIILLNPPTKR